MFSEYSSRKKEADSLQYQTKCREQIFTGLLKNPEAKKKLIYR